MSNKEYKEYGVTFVEGLVKENLELQAKLEALKPYIRHKSPCEFKTVGLSKCACGLLQALEQKP